MQLGQLARQNHRLPGPKHRNHILKRAQDAMRGFVEDLRRRQTRSLPKLFQCRASCPLLRRQETVKREAFRRQPARNQGAQGGVCAGNGKDRYIRCDRGADEPFAWIRDARHTRIADHRQPPARAQWAEQLLRPARFVVQVVAHGGLLDPIVM